MSFILDNSIYLLFFRLGFNFYTKSYETESFKEFTRKPCMRRVIPDFILNTELSPNKKEFFVDAQTTENQKQQRLACSNHNVYVHPIIAGHQSSVTIPISNGNVH